MIEFGIAVRQPSPHDVARAMMVGLLNPPDTSFQRAVPRTRRHEVTNEAMMTEWFAEEKFWQVVLAQKPRIETGNT